MCGVVSSFGFILSLCFMCLIAKYSIDRHKLRTNPGHGKGEKQREIRIKKKKKKKS